jgi:hypothetical protein
MLGHNISRSIFVTIELAYFKISRTPATNFFKLLTVLKKLKIIMRNGSF